jgi:hypothetical protein
MERTRSGEPLCGQFQTTHPSIAARLTTALERVPSVAKHTFPKQPQTIEISRHSIVIKVALHD